MDTTNRQQKRIDAHRHNNHRQKHLFQRTLLFFLFALPRMQSALRVSSTWMPRTRNLCGGTASRRNFVSCIPPSAIQSKLWQNYHPKSPSELYFSSTSTTQQQHKSSQTRLGDMEEVDDLQNSSDLPQLSEMELKEIEELSRTWRSHPALNPTLEFPCWKVPVQTLQTIMQSTLAQRYFASRIDTWNHVSNRSRPRMVLSVPQDSDDKHDEGISYKRILLRPNVPPPDQLPKEVQQLLQECKVISDDTTTFTHTLRPRDFTASYVLDHILPKEVHPPPTSFETIGHVAHLNLRSLHVPYRYVIGECFLETLPNIRTVIQKVGHVSGPYRTYPYEIVAERGTKSKSANNKNEQSSTMVSFTESGVNLRFDVREVYWSSRLSEERRRLIDEEFQEGEWIADAFCGVGALCLQAALKKQCRITANDWNPSAIEALKQNAKRNKLQDAFFEISCADAYDFLTSLGFTQKDENSSSKKSSNPPGRLPDHVVLNFPLNAASFLGALRWWPVGGKRRRSTKNTNTQPVVPRVHVYIFAKESSDKDASIESAKQNAVDEIASHLLPSLPGEGETQMTRWEELDQNFGCNIKVHNVRDVAPGKVVLCVSFSATERLLRFMQGDF